MCIPPLYRKPGKRVAVEVDGTIDSILVWAVKWRNFTTCTQSKQEKKLETLADKLKDLNMVQFLKLCKKQRPAVFRLMLRFVLIV
jgi:hypothetical protein